MQKSSIIFQAERESYKERERKFINDILDLVILHAILSKGGLMVTKL